MLKFRVSLLSLALLLGVSATAPAIAKTTAVATAAAQPQIASGSEMIVDLNTN
ncbi:D-alanyl-D-alanine endopeptidase, partial [Klebsiella pneumoniae]|nr:D-alanyl-D-alanine endopeptidase [Klebsiella pneumoniae]